MLDIQMLRHLYNRAAHVEAMLQVHFEGYKLLPKTDADKPARIVNNLIKQELIHNVTKAGDRFLDLPCGSGKDVEKIQHLGIAEYVGIDLDYNDALLEAAKKRESVIQMGNKCKLHKGNMCKPFNDLPDVNPESFDVISCQFAMHYAFEDEPSAIGFMNNISRYLKPGGVFIATYPDGDNILAHWRVSDFFGNSHYHIKFDSPVPQESVHYGAKYHFRLTTCVDDPEFLIRDSVLLQMFASKNFELVHLERFESFCKRKDDDSTIGLAYTALDADNKEIVDLYKLCVFRKK
jgi:mRNA (guanine-N7-)-methyltransferase